MCVCVYDLATMGAAPTVAWGFRFEALGCVMHKERPREQGAQTQTQTHVQTQTQTTKETDIHTPHTHSLSTATHPYSPHTSLLHPITRLSDTKLYTRKKKNVSMRTIKWSPRVVAMSSVPMPGRVFAGNKGAKRKEREGKTFCHSI